MLRQARSVAVPFCVFVMGALQGHVFREDPLGTKDLFEEPDPPSVVFARIRSQALNPRVDSRPSARCDDIGRLNSQVWKFRECHRSLIHPLTIPDFLGGGMS